MKLPDKVYEALKWICLIFIPAVIVLLTTVLPPLGIDPATVKLIDIVLGAVATFIGTLIGVSTIAYKLQRKENKIEERK